MREQYRPLVISFDLDDVLTHTAVRLISEYNAQFGQNVDVRHFYTEVNMDTWGTDSLALVQSRIEHVAAIIDREPPEVRPEAMWGIRTLASRGHELHVNTGRDETRYRVTRRILNDYFGGYFDSLTMTNQFVAPGRAVERVTKGIVTVALEADIHIDDHPGHGYDVLDAGTPNAVVYGRFPWNEDCKERPGLTRSDDWRHLIAKVDELAAA